MKTIPNRLLECGQVEELDWNNFFVSFWKKLIFHVSDSTFFIKKMKKWEKMSFDGLFELVIVDLVGIEYQIIKIG